jgi:hypothetical protein
MAGWFSKGRITPPEQRAADALEDARLVNYDDRRGARSPSPRAQHRWTRKAARDAAWAAEQAARPSLLRRASQGALELVRGTPRGALNLVQIASRGALNLAQGASRRASNYLRDRAAAAAAAADAAAADAAAAAAAAHRAVDGAHSAAARRAAAAAAAVADAANIAAARRAAAAAAAVADAPANAAAAAAPANAAADADNRELECSICYSNAIAGQAANPEDEAVLVNCPASHRFHRGCIEKWIVQCKGRAPCPNCRGEVTTFTAAKKGGGYRTRGRRTRSKSKSRRYPRKPHKTRKV